jgi:predicted Zn finger-like uncharacterized protein
MPISVQCPACKQGYTLADAQAGKHVRCKSCSGVFQVPAAEEIAEVLPAEEDYWPGRRPPPLPAGRDDEDDRPRRSIRRPPGVPVWVWPAVGGGVALVVIVVVLVLTLGGGGGGKITPENANRIHPGMSEKEVQAILGAPTEVVDPMTMFKDNPLFQQNPALKNNPMLGNLQNVMPMKICVWKSGRNSITVTFINGQVTMHRGDFSS